MKEVTTLVVSYGGWTLTEIWGLSKRERANWLEIAIELGRARRKTDNVI